MPSNRRERSERAIDFDDFRFPVPDYLLINTTELSPAYPITVRAPVDAACNDVMRVIPGAIATVADRARYEVNDRRRDVVDIVRA